MKILLAILMAALCLNTSADVLIYKQKVSYTINGGGTTSRLSLSGYFIFDPEAANWITLVQVDPKTKSFWVEYPDEVTFDYVNGVNGKTHMVWTRTDSWLDDDNKSHINIATLKGPSSAQSGQALGTVQNWNVPRSGKSLGTFIYPDAQGRMIWEESVGSVGLDSKLTKTANLAGDDIDSAEQRVRMLLQSQGYLEDVSRPATESKLGWATKPRVSNTK